MVFTFDCMQPSRDEIEGLVMGYVEKEKSKLGR